MKVELNLKALYTSEENRALSEAFRVARAKKGAVLGQEEQRQVHRQAITRVRYPDIGLSDAAPGARCRYCGSRLTESNGAWVNRLGGASCGVRSYDTDPYCELAHVPELVVDIAGHELPAEPGPEVEELTLALEGV